MISPHDKEVIKEVMKITDVQEVNFNRIDDKVEIIGKDLDQRYLHTLRKLSISREAIENQQDLKIVFSPIHGTGVTLVPDALKLFGFTNVNLVEEQCSPDGNFPTVVYPNPEEEEALTMALKKGQEIDADLIMATDPDGDRVGIAVKNDKNEFVLLNGNQTRDIAFTTFDNNDVTPLGLSYLINTSKAIILSSLRDLKASMAEIIIE